MNPLRLFLIIVTLPLLLGGCGKEPVVEVQPVEEKVLEVKEEVNFIEFKELEKRDDGLHYKRGDKSPYSGKAYDVSLSGNKKEEGSFKNGLKDGLWIEWDNLQRKTSQVHYSGGKLHGISVHWGPVSRELSRENYEEGKLVELPEKAAGLVNLSDLRMGLDGLRFPSSNKPYSGAVFSLHYSNGE